jgi:2,5-diketo-D-gluconate reductase A
MVPARAPAVELFNAALPGTRMPAAGLGTDFRFCENASSSGNASYGPSLQWLRLGGRRFDGALSYGCDRGVGEAIRASGVNRRDVFVTSKIGPGGLPLPLGHNETLAQAARILADLNDSYVDLLLVHEPFSYWPDPSAASKAPSSDAACNLRDPRYSPTQCRLSTWRAMVLLWRAGKARSIGVSNYNSSHIEEIVAAGLPLPAVNQIQYSPHHGPSHSPCTCGQSTSRPTLHCGSSAAEQHESCLALLSYLSSRRIAPNGYSPFEGKAGGGSLLHEPALLAIATAHNVTASQVVLHWQWRRHGVLVNPTATSAEYQRQNLDFGGFALTPAEARALDEWPQNPLPR